jgi:hypothetical protein
METPSITLARSRSSALISAPLRAGLIVRTVFAPQASVIPGALSGGYAGGTASATIGVGIGANALVGGSNNTVALQPLSIEGDQGLNVAAVLRR